MANVPQRQRLHDSNVETPQPPSSAHKDKESELEELLQVYWGCPRCLRLTRRRVSCRCRYLNGDLENLGRKLLGWPQVTTLPSHEECHRREEQRRRYIYVSSQAVIDRKTGQIITEDQMDDQDKNERYFNFAGIWVYDRDRNETISEERMEVNMAMQKRYHDREQRYFFVKNRVYDAISNEFLSLEQFTKRQAAVERGRQEGQEEAMLQDALGDEGGKVAANQQEREQRVASEDEDEEPVGEPLKKVRRVEWRTACGA